ncbi:cyclin-dependent kinase inhibitor 2-like isoform X3 [Leptopilina heterotoma]|uniref:cyclin-dependent kinase inhibitor 2-like isoform X3 n=1 Tax=Leptopilina heterotoma TaxID=63436 RepID=UPI001CA8EBE9|nr:cyclin-dependent kinase inhibitor 2-like isoform X3 [Leptopilina heterotoma]
MRDLPISARLAMQDQNYEAPEANRIRKVRRRLFEDEDKHDDKDNNINLVSEERRRHLEQAKEKWNFDFEKEKPLPGNYQWIKVNKKETSKQEENEDTLQNKQED